MTDRVSLTETYTLLMLYGGGDRTDHMACQFSAGIVLGGLTDLLRARCVQLGPDGRLTPVSPPGLIPPSCAALYGDLCQYPPKPLREWLDHYCFRPTHKAVRPLVDDVVNQLAARGCLRVEWRCGLLSRKRHIEIDPARARPAAEAFVHGVLAGEVCDEWVFCTEMLLLADVFKSYFPMGRRAAIKGTLDRYRRTALWQRLAPLADAVRNFNYQNTVYTGASL